MLKKIITLILTLSGSLVFGLPENIPDDVPEGVIEVMKEIETNPDARVGLNQMKRPRWVDTSLKINEISTGYPFKIYTYRNKGNVLDTCSIKTSFDSLIEPSEVNSWWFPVFNKDEFLYYVKVIQKREKWKATGAGKGHQQIWNENIKFFRKYIRDHNASPIIVRGVYDLLYLPKRKGNKLSPNVLMSGSSFKRRAKKSNEYGFIGSEEVIGEVIKRWNENRESRERWRRKHPETFKKRKGDKK